MKLSVFTIGLTVATFFAVNSPAASAQTLEQTSPNQQPKTYTVNPGDNLSAIATAHQTTYKRLFDANPQIVDADLIYPGAVLRVPEPSEQLADRPLPAPVYVYQPATPVYRKSVAATSAPAPVAGDASVWDRLAQCESGGNWGTNTGNGYYGGLQFTPGTWAGVGGSGLPSDASKEEQIARAQILQQRRGFSPWPACSARVGL